MSVHATQRTESLLHVHIVCDDFVAHTLTKVANTRKFGVTVEQTVTPADDGSLHIETRVNAGHAKLGQRLEDAALGCGESAWRANDIRVGEHGEGYIERRALQDAAIRNADAFLYLVRLTRKHCGLTGREVKAWADKARDAKAILRRWRDSDAARYAGRL